MRSTLTKILSLSIIISAALITNAQVRLVKGIYGKGTFNGYSAAEYVKNKNVFALSYETMQVKRNDFKSLVTNNNESILKLSYRSFGLSYRREGNKGTYGFQSLFGLGVQSEDFVIWSGLESTQFNSSANRDFTKTLKLDAFFTLRKHLSSGVFVGLTYQPGYRMLEKQIINGRTENPFKEGFSNNIQINVGFAIPEKNPLENLDTFKRYHAIGLNVSHLHYGTFSLNYEKRFKPNWSYTLDLSAGTFGNRERVRQFFFNPQSFNKVTNLWNYGIGSKYFFSANRSTSLYVLARAHYQTAIFERTSLFFDGTNQIDLLEKQHITNFGGSMGIGVILFFKNKWFIDVSTRSGMQWSNYNANVNIDHFPIKSGSLTRHQFTLGRTISK